LYLKNESGILIGDGRSSPPQRQKMTVFAFGTSICEKLLTRRAGAGSFCSQLNDGRASELNVQSQFYRQRFGTVICLKLEQTVTESY